MRLLALVPVRAGSRGLPGKNTRPLRGVPLWRRAVDQGLAAGADTVIVSTDIAEVLAAEVPERVLLLERPADLAGDDVPMDPVIGHALAAVPGPARVLLLQATAPLRSLHDIAATLARHAEGDIDLAMTVTPADPGVLKWGFVQDGRFTALVDPAHPFQNRHMLPPVWRPNGAVYAFDADWFRRHGRLACDRIGAVPMPDERALDIDTAPDLVRAETLIGKG